MIEFLIIPLSLYVMLTAFLAMNGFLEDDSYIIALVLIAAYLLLTVVILFVIILWGRQ